MACGGAITATVLTAGAGLAGSVGGNPLESISGAPLNITDATTGLAGSPTMAAFTSNQASFQALASPTALTSTISGV